MLRIFILRSSAVKSELLSIFLSSRPEDISKQRWLDTVIRIKEPASGVVVASLAYFCMASIFVLSSFIPHLFIIQFVKLLLRFEANYVLIFYDQLIAFLYFF